MNPQIVVWAGAFLFTAAAAVGMMLAPPLAVPEGNHTDVVVQQDPAKLSDRELDIILTGIRKGDLLAQQKEIEKARDEWSAARERGKGYWPIHEGLGDSYARWKMAAEARVEYATALKLLGGEIPDRVSTLRRKLADVCEAVGDRAEALQ